QPAPQFPQQQPAPQFPQQPGLLPPGLGTPTKPTSPATPQPTSPMGNASTSGTPAEITLPYAEQKMALSVLDAQVKRIIGEGQVVAGQKIIRDVGDNEMNARDMARVFRDLRPTEWVTIGGAKPVVEYGLINGRPTAAPVMPDSKNDPSAGVSAGVGQARF